VRSVYSHAGSNKIVRPNHDVTLVTRIFVFFAKIVIYDMCIVMWNFTIRDGKIVQQAEGELDNASSIVTTHYDTNIVQRFIYFHN
jgi:hypothetical protein